MVGNPLLFDALISALPQFFLRRLTVDIPRAYHEASQMADLETLWEEPEADYIRPQNRRCIIEALVRRAAQDAGLKATVIRTDPPSAQYTLVRACEFVLTTSYVDSPDKLPRDVRFRRQNACLNGYAAQMCIAGLENNDAAYFDGGPTNCVLLHGADALDKRRLGFVEFAFPHPGYTHWFQRYSLANLLLASQQRNPPRKSDDNVRPQIKKIPKEGTGDQG